MADQNDRTEFEGVITGSSSKAVLFQGDFWDKPEWVPRSQCEIVPQSSDEQGRAILYVNNWLVKKNGWE